MIYPQKINNLENFKDTYSFICPACHYQCLLSVTKEVNEINNSSYNYNFHSFTTPSFNNYFVYSTCQSCKIQYTFVPNNDNCHFTNATYYFSTKNDISQVTIFMNTAKVFYRNSKNLTINAQLNVISHKALLEKIKIYETFE